MKLNRRLIPIILIFIPFVNSIAQNSNYYIFPIRTGQQNFLSGNMGEMRSNHFHAGIDIKTGGVEGLPIYAAADGFISRIKTSSWGYGNALYVQHPNGESTVYAHLLNYSDPIQDYVRAAQYAQKTFEIELFPERDKFPVKQGEVIAFSGNTGGSGGPHLHFEIRDKNQEVLNPLTYKFSEVVDNIPPDIDRIALITLEKDARINDQFGRFEFSLSQSGSKYQIKESISLHGLVGIELLGYDRANGANNRNGISCIETFMDEELIFYQNIAKFSFSETRDILAFHNYPIYKQTGRRFYKLYVDEGNSLPFYSQTKNKGKLKIEHSSKHQVTINAYDAYQNKSQVSFQVIHKEPASQLNASAKNTGSSGSEIIKNTLKITSQTRGLEQNSGLFFANRMQYQRNPDYTHGVNSIYLWDLSKGLPDSVIINHETWKYGFDALIPSGKTFNLYKKRFNVYFPKTALYDTLYFTSEYGQDGKSELFSIGNDIFPLRKNIYVTLKPSLSYKNKEKTHVYSVSSSGSYNFEGGDWENSNIKFNTRNFGKFTILADTIPPRITPIRVNKDELRFTITDGLSGIHSYEASINDEWILMQYDYKRDLIWSDKLNKNLPFSGNLVLRVKDQAGNIAEHKTKL